MRLAGLLPALLLAGCASEEAPPPPAPGAEARVEASDSRAVFRDVTDAWGLDFRHDHGGTGRKYLPEIMGSGGAVLDFDGDGRLDLYLVQSGPVPGTGDDRPRPVNRLYRNVGADGGVRFEDVTEGSGAGDDGYGMGAVAADYDNDGDPDLYVVNFGPDVLLRNDGPGPGGRPRFTDVTREAGIKSPLWGSSAAFFDADSDGWLDLYVVNYLDFTVEKHVDCGTPSEGVLSYCHPDVYDMAPDVFFWNRGGGADGPVTFVEATSDAGLVDTTGKGLGALAADLTGDGWPDVHVANDSTPNFLFRNLGRSGPPAFEEAGLELGVGYNEEGLTEAGMGNAVGDVDGDGALDLFVTNLNGETNALYLGGEDFFTYHTRQSGLYAGSYMPVGFGTELLDLDHDGDLDVLVTNGHVIDNVELIDDAQSFRQPSQLFWNDGRGNFSQASAAEAGDLAVPRVGRGTLVADFDDDGRQEVVITTNDDRARLFSNQLTDVGHWIGFALEGTAGNRDAVGARVTVEAGGRSWVDVKTAGSSYQTSSDPRLHFGLGEAATVDRVSVAWPGGATEVFEGLAASRYHTLTEGKAVLR